MIHIYMIIQPELLNFTIYHSNNLSINPYTTSLQKLSLLQNQPEPWNYQELSTDRYSQRTAKQRRIKNKELCLHGAKIRHVSVAHSTRNRLSLTTYRTPARAWAPATVSNGNKCHVSAIKCVKMLIRPEHTATATETTTTTRMATTSGETAKTKRMKEWKKEKNKSRKTGQLLDCWTLLPTFLALSSSMQISSQRNVPLYWVYTYLYV